MNLTARQSNKKEFGPVDMRPNTGFASAPIVPGVNWFAPMNTKLVQQSLRFSNRQQRRDLFALGLSQENIPKEFDWRDPNKVRQLPKYKNLTDAQILGFINPVMNQGQCGSCWAVSSTMMLSDRIAIASKKPYVKLDINNVLACAASAGDNGCGGGYLANAGQYFESKGTTTDCIPYSPTMTVGPACAQVQNQCQSKPKVFARRGTTRDFAGDIDQIQTDIMNNGPVVAGYQVDQGFMSYRGGVWVQPNNMNTVGGHAVVIVGWGFDDSLKRGYWIVRNSWGEQWGERGYFRFAWGNTNDRRDGRFLENYAVTWQAKVEEVKGGDDEKDPTPTPTPPGPSPPEPEPEPEPEMAKLATGTIVAISVSSVVLIVAIIVIAILASRKRF